MLKSDYQYLFLDFETTGLDPKKDEPIQIGIVLCDSNLHVIEKYSSYIRPEVMSISDLKTHITRLTWIDFSKLEHAPSRSEVLQQISHFFTDKTVIIWHNISFDIKFLQWYFSDLPLSWFSIDTYDLAKVFVHWAWSLALESLHRYLQTNQIYIKATHDLWNLSHAHDALIDCLVCVALIRFYNQKLDKLLWYYKILPVIISHTVQEWWIRFFEVNNWDVSLWWIYLPVAHSANYSHNTPIHRGNDFLSKYQSSSKFFAWESFEKSLLALVSEHKTIIAFQTKSKLDLAKQIFYKHNIKNIWFLKSDVELNEDRLKQFWQFAEYQLFELAFAIKWCSHHDQWLGVIECNSPGDYQCYNFLYEPIETSEYPLVLATHAWVYRLVDDKKYQWYRVILWDTDWWYQSFLEFTTSKFDSGNFFMVLDNLIYTYFRQNHTALATLQEFSNWMTITLWNYGMWMKDLTVNMSSPDGFFEISPVSTYTQLSKFQWSATHFSEWIEKLISICGERESAVIIKLLYKLMKILDHTHRFVRKSNESGDGFEVIYQQTYVDFSEYILFFKDYQTFFITNKNIEWLPFIPPVILKEDSIISQTESSVMSNTAKHHVTWIKSLDQLEQFRSIPRIFVYQSSKNSAKKTFDYLLSKWRDKDKTILVENITGWRGKQLVRLASEPQAVIVGSWDLLYLMRWQWIEPDQIIVIWLQWTFHDQIMRDLNFYKMKSVS